MEQESKFHALGIAPQILKVLDERGFVTPTPIQQQSIPAGIAGKDLVGIAQTGTGKTFAFGIPMIQRLSQMAGRGLVVVPTRELAYQVEESLQTFAPLFGIKTAVLVGGASMGLQKQMIRNNPRIVIATPGRLNDHLEQRTITLKEVNILVLDEADRMLDMGFKPQIDRILAHVPKERQTMLFSATMPKEIMQLAESQMKLPLRIEVARAGTAAELVQQELFIVEKAQKLSLLGVLLKEHAGTVLVFSRTKHGAKKITAALRHMGESAAEIHANRSLAQRREALDGFKSGKYRVLVATDIAARGIDVTGIAVVINYDLPDDANDYVHRIGRTARAGREGIAISFAAPDQAANVRAIEKLIRLSIKRRTAPGLPAIHIPAQPRADHSRSQTPGHTSRGPSHGNSHRRRFSGRSRRRS
jgi:ATP-dependent RNA helicase RhlE